MQIQLWNKWLSRLCSGFVFLTALSATAQERALPVLNNYGYYFDTNRLNDRLYRTAKMVINHRDSAWEMLRQDIAICRLAGDISCQVRTLKSIALFYSIRGREKEAAAYYLKAIELAENNPADYADEKKGWLYNNIVSVFYNLRQMDKAQEYLEKSKSIAERLDLPRMRAAGYIAESALTAARSGSPQDAIHLLLKARNEFPVLPADTGDGNSQTLFTVFENLSHEMAKAGRSADALAYLDSAWLLSPQLQQYHVNGLYFHTAQVYLLLKEYDSCISYTRRAAARFTEAHNLRALTGCYSMLTDAYTGKGMPDSALSALMQHSRLKDSLVNTEVIRTVRELEAQYKTARKDRELSEQRLQNTRHEMYIRTQHRWLWSVSLFSVLAALAALLLLVLLRRSRLLRDKEQELQAKQKQLLRLNTALETEERERSRIGRDLHDGIGGMIAAAHLNLKTAIHRNKGISDLRDFETVEELLQSTAREIRKTAHNLIPESISGHDLRAAVTHYIDLIRQGSTLDIQLFCHEVPGNMSAALSTSLYRMVQELIQNIIRHAGASRATVQIRYLHPVLTIQVEDNGLGFSAGTGSYPGIGLNNIRKRIELMQGSFYIESSPGKGTVAFIELDPQIRNTVN